MEREISSILFCTNKKAAFAALLFVVSISFQSFAQKETIKLYPTAGATLRAGIMNFYNFKTIWSDRPYNLYPSERNIDGLSLNPGLAIALNHFEVEYFLNLRYDVVHYSASKENSVERDFLLDHNINFAYRRKASYGIGFSIINSGKGFWYDDPTPRYQDIEFKTVNFFVTIPVWKILNLEIKALYMPNGYPYNRNEDYIMYSLRLYYRFNFLNK